MQRNTHLDIDMALCGTPVELSPGRAVVRLATLPAMAADDRGLVHGGFVFGLADHAAMLAVNDPRVVLGAATVRFTAPVVVGEEIAAEATVTEGEGKKRLVEVTVRREATMVLSGTFTCVIPSHHVLDR
ncbi:PaaI family thioesterase [Solidesulfovibrio sp. C21]|uniref:PaaI family thioesterase n=1 Tax=Solidesulfovibrio sp. C21 TaxID=3398613 RepID=UPI0039FD46DF